MWYINQADLNSTTEYPGVAKFGIALEWGSRGRWFESSHSDQIAANEFSFAAISVYSYIINTGLHLQAVF